MVNDKFHSENLRRLMFRMACAVCKCDDHKKCSTKAKEEYASLPKVYRSAFLDFAVAKGWIAEDDTDPEKWIYQGAFKNIRETSWW